MTSLLALVMTCSLCVPTLAAGEGSYTMAIQVNGSSNATVKPGSTVTVTLTLSKDNADSFDLYSMQDYVRFDTDYFSYVDGSLSAYTTGGSKPVQVFSAGVIDYPGSGEEDNAIFVNRASNSVQTLSSGVTVISFQLKAEATGTTTLTHDTTEVFQTSGNLFDTTCENATVTISNDAVDPDPEPEPDPEPTPDPDPEPTPDPGEDEDQPNVPSDPDDGQDDQTRFPFIDVPHNAWYRTAVEYAYSRGLMAGTSSILFSPDMTTSRGMIVTILYSLEGKPYTSSSPFDDVSITDWYGRAVAWAAAHGVVSGYSDTAFGPNDSITREQMATILYSYARYKGCDVSARADLSGFQDVGRISPYAVTAMQWACAEGLISGMGDRTLAPQGNATRAQVAQILMQFCEKVL